MRRDPRPVLFVTNHAPPFRVPAFAALHERENVVFALVGGDVRHGGGGTRGALPFPALAPPERAIARLAASGRYRAVIAGLSGRVALPAAYAGARAARVPFVLWATIWRHPRTPAHALSYLPLRHIYRHADAIATYGPHVTRYVRTKGANQPIFEAPQSVDTAFWTIPGTPDRRAPFQVLFAGPPGGGKGAAGVDGGLERPPPHRCPRAVRRRSVPSPGRRRRRNRARPALQTRTAQLLRRERRCGHTVSPHA